MITFQGFKPSGLEKIANAMGFQGEEKDFQKFLEENPDRQAEMLRYQDIARKMVEGGYVRKMQEGGDVEQPEEPKKKTIRDISLDRVTDPKVPTGATVSPYGIPTGDAGQTISTDVGQVGDAPTMDVATADLTKAEAPKAPEVIAFDDTGLKPEEELKDLPIGELGLAMKHSNACRKEELGFRKGG